MNNKILQKSLEKINERRSFAKQKAKQNFEIAYANAEFKELYTKQKELEIEIAKCEAFGEKADYSTLNEIKLKQEFVLKKLNLNGTDITPNYECKMCEDTGYTHGHMCDCLKNEINKQLLIYSGFNGVLSTFEDSTVSSPALNLMQKWCTLDNNKINVVISGPTGTGKTFITECVASALMQNHKTVLFTTAFNLNNAMLNYHISFDSQREEILKPYLTTEVLIIDDLGTEPILKNVTKEYLYLILNERMQSSLRTIITTNLDLPDILNSYGERTFSRLINKKQSLAINLTGEDLRLKK